MASGGCGICVVGADLLASGGCGESECDAGGSG